MIDLPFTTRGDYRGLNPCTGDARCWCAPCCAAARDLFERMFGERWGEMVRATPRCPELPTTMPCLSLLRDWAGLLSPFREDTRFLRWPRVQLEAHGLYARGATVDEALQWLWWLSAPWGGNDA